MKKIILINAPISFDLEKIVGDESWCPPLGLLYIAAVLEKNNYQVQIVDIKAQKLTLKNVLQIIKNEAPLLIGISALTPSIRSAVTLATAIKEKITSSIPIILGGSHVSAAPEIIKRYPCFDIGVIGEGERAFLEIANKITNNEKLTGIITANVIENLDDLPLPARHLLEKNNYTDNGFIITSRGCPYNCIFCAVSSLSKRTRFRSATNILEEIEKIYQDFNGKIIFLDDTFTLNRANVVNLCQEIIKRKLPLQWVASTRVDKVDDELLTLMKQAGCTELAFGIESGNERVRNEIIGKGIKNEQIKNIVTLCKKNKIKVAFYLMLGFPGETREEMLETARCGTKFGADLIGLHPTLPLPGSRIYQKALAENKITAQIIDDYIRSDDQLSFRDFWPIYVPTGLTAEDIFRIRKRGYLKFYFQPRFIFNKIKEDLTSWTKFKNDVKSAIDIIRFGRSKTSMS